MSPFITVTMVSIDSLLQRALLSIRTKTSVDVEDVFVEVGYVEDEAVVGGEFENRGVVAGGVLAVGVEEGGVLMGKNVTGVTLGRLVFALSFLLSVVVTFLPYNSWIPLMSSALSLTLGSNPL